MRKQPKTEHQSVMGDTVTFFVPSMEQRGKPGVEGSYYFGVKALLLKKLEESFPKMSVAQTYVKNHTRIVSWESTI